MQQNLSSQTPREYQTCPGTDIRLETLPQVCRTGWPRPEHSIRQHLANRQQLIVVIMKLSRAVDEQHIDLAGVQLKRLCNDLVDYLSNTHFNLYQHAFPPPEATPREYAILETTTRSAMAFDERWCGAEPLVLSELKEDLARVILTLETHFEMEDELLDLKLVESFCFS